MSLHDHGEVKPESVADAVTDLKLDPDRPFQDLDEKSSTKILLKGSVVSTTREIQQGSLNEQEIKINTQSQSPIKQDFEDGAAETKAGDGITVKMEPGQPPKLARSSTKVSAPPPRLFYHLPNSTAEAEATFDVMKTCTYANKYMGYTEHGMECDCAEEWDPTALKNDACGEDSDCINRATKMECVGDCGCGADCQNQRFQRQEYAKVNVIKTEKKGFGLRAQTDLRPNQFIYEYIGEVINEAQFRRRMHQYDEEGIKHFYFMSLSKGEFVDATKKGNLARFCNHSCNPNCYVDKWVVGDKLRMGIFAERKILAGEELVFNYNVDRYGADPQPCYCSEPNCTGFIGGKTQTERATKLSNATIEALGIEDADDWDVSVAKKPRKRKTGEADEEYVDSVQPRSLDEDGVTKVMAALMQCKEKWIAVKLLNRIQRCDDERVRNRVVKMHGYQILKSQLTAWIDDVHVVLQILDILDKFPRLTRNKIIDSKIESTIEPLKACGDERVEQRAVHLLDVWATLEVGYRIPRVKRDPATTSTPQTTNHYERREITHTDTQRSKSRSRSRSRSIEAPRGPAAQMRGAHNHRGNRTHGPRPFRRAANPLPPGWFAAESNGRTYYYSARGETTWIRPTTAANQPPPPNKPERRDKALQDIIDGIMNAKNDMTPKDKTMTPDTPQPTKPAGDKREGEPKWRSYPEEKQKRIYENTLFPHVKYVMDKFRSKLPKEDLKRYAKEVAKKLVNSDFKNNRVDDPAQIGEKRQKKVKNFCKEYFEKAVQKHRAHEQKKTERVAPTSESQNGSFQDGLAPLDDSFSGHKDDSDAESNAPVSDDEADGSHEIRSLPMDLDSGDSLKRKRDDTQHRDFINGTSSPVKRVKSSTPSPSNIRRRGDGDVDDDINEDDDDNNTNGTHSAVDIHFNVDHRTKSDTPPPPPPPPPPPADSPGDCSPTEPNLSLGIENDLMNDGNHSGASRSASVSPFPSERYPDIDKKLGSSNYVGIEGQVR